MTTAAAPEPNVGAACENVKCSPKQSANKANVNDGSLGGLAKLTGVGNLVHVKKQHNVGKEKDSEGGLAVTLNVDFEKMVMDAKHQVEERKVGVI